ncbi:hypothetical protein G9455_11590 [Aeromonas hydrophila]|uniref:hypothetical protein n=1 Tax=Aeromonas hydrophila TaxID=644 RepID=UPI0007505E63|nr:hypothetical protein [Aeromonas hydrophila]MCA4697991.1 hypothetical protein [Aeromonas hydrophila]QIO18447.1 hypothetical protein G9455_11590 [Aeromonas hydrophila]USJ78865.1 hypothetical protein LDP97_07425 [Aeromonas hydrophila]UUT52616.1 hypothetical protein MOO39_11140 [Aeromonas hydrophila]CAD7534388.1 hypothetical protein KBAHV27_22910 [Aeromonas hydrophila]
MKKSKNHIKYVPKGELRKIINSALSNTKFSMRSIEGIAKEAHVSEEQLEQLINDDQELANEIKIMPFRSKDGKVLLMSKKRFLQEASLKIKFIDFFASKRQGIKNA